MDFATFESDIALGHYHEAIASGEPVRRAVKAQNYAPSSAQFMLLAQAATYIDRYRDALLTALGGVSGTVATWVAVLLHAPSTREAVLSRLRTLIAGNDEPTLTNVCRVIQLAPPVVTAEFVPRLLQLHQHGPPAVRCYALRSLGMGRHKEGLPAAYAAISVDDDNMRRAVATYFKYDLSSPALKMLTGAVKDLPPMTTGWTAAVKAIADAGLLAADIAPDLLSVLRDLPVPPVARAEIAGCLLLITLDVAITAEVIRTVRTLLEQGISTANARDRIPADTHGESLEEQPPEVAGCLRMSTILIDYEELYDGIDDLVVAALTARDWDIRAKSAELSAKYSITGYGIVPALISVLADLIAAATEDPLGLLPDAAYCDLHALKVLGIAAAPAAPMLERFVTEIKPAAGNDGNLELAKEVLRHCRSTDS